MDQPIPQSRRQMSEIKRYPYEDTWPFYKAIYEEFGGKQLVWGTGYPRPRWELGAADGQGARIR